MRGSGVVLPLPVTRKFFIVFYYSVSFCARPRVEVTRPHRGDPVPSQSTFAERQRRPRVLAVVTKASEPAVICEIKDSSCSHRPLEKGKISQLRHIRRPRLLFFPPHAVPQRQLNLTVVTVKSFENWLLLKKKSLCQNNGSLTAGSTG